MGKRKDDFIEDNEEQEDFGDESDESEEGFSIFFGYFVDS